MSQIAKPNVGQSLLLGALDTINWNSNGVTGALKFDLLVSHAVAGTIAESVQAAKVYQ